MVKVRRKKYCINKPIQIGYFGLTAWFICIGILLVGSLTYYFTLNTIIEQIQLSAQNFDALDVVHKINLILQKKLSLVFIFLLIVAGALVILYLHRVVGPIYRIEKILRDVIEGKPFQTISLRRKDSFKTLAQTINAFVTYYESRFQKIKETLEKQGISDSDKIDNIKEIFKN